MKHNVFGRILAGLVLLAILVGIGALAYHAGVNNGLVQAGTVNGEVERTIPYYGMHHGFGFGPFGLLLGLFLFFIAFGALRRLIWGPRMMHGPWMRGPWMHGPMQGGPEQGVPPFFAEWHRQAHAQEDKKE